MSTHEDRINCCTGKKINGCEGYKPENSSCDKYLEEFCSLNDNIVRDARCINWYNNNANRAQQTKANFCLNNMNRSECQNWCKDMSASGNNICDEKAISWCEYNPQHPFCSCIKSPLHSKWNINPKCNDAKCLLNGYLTQNMRFTECPDITNCSIVNKITNSGVSVVGIDPNQSCSEHPVQNKTAPFSSAPFSFVDYFLLFYIFCLFIAFVFLGIYLYQKKKI